ncbi:regulator of G-protein signaling 22-like [Octopus sinensis]|uniref:Regulator of G-protein signaling 22-like n=1 Tax=Octopus sinensis TaxID=2607531 RepID=A0A7E6FKW8_9MOLL|nr:regulator of G-protein signaling 22-like [Octopus sinensis]
MTHGLPMLPEMAPVLVETVGESMIGWTQRQHPMPKVVKVNRIFGAVEQMVDPWTGHFEDHLETTKIKLVSTLLVTLREESKCGNYFENFLTKCKNKLALNCLYLYHNIEKFLQIFYTQPINMFRICRYAKFIYSKFIATGSPFSVRAGPKVMLFIWQNLDDPVGDMFDEVVEHILTVLAKFWHRLLLEESWIYRKVCL